jgi:GTP diphosphokinase / guanosine-3',5'-bis(diphosphate) 3'-diphosphatase
MIAQAHLFYTVLNVGYTFCMVNVAVSGFAELIERAKQYIPPEKVTAIENAYQFALEAHAGQERKSGNPYIEHPVSVALTLAELQLDGSSLAAALLHDVPEDTGTPLSVIEEKFGPEVAKLVDGVTKLGRLSSREHVARSEGQAENLRKMLLAMAQDLRVVFIKLADRLHNMRTLEFLPPEKQRSIARETLEIYAPLAHRLGIWELKWQLEDLSFMYLEPRKYQHIYKLLSAKSMQHEAFITRAINTLREEFDRVDMKVEISGRPKHIYSIYQKMEKYTALGKDFDDIHDLIAIRILVNSREDCYSALGIVHGLWHPLPDQFNDYIANPKPNGYQSLHTTVMYDGTTPLEVQIRTNEMHRISEFGVAAHWRYKAGEKKDLHYEERIGWLRQLIEWHRELSGAEEFLESVKTDIFMDQVFVYTPKGEIKDLPKGATPLDFAYRIHTDLGHRCTGAKVNGRLVPLNYQLKNGDIVEIMTTKTKRGPSRDWLNPVIGYVMTSHAKEKIRQWFKKQERTENIERGRELLEKAMRQLGINQNERDSLALAFKYDNLEDFYAAIGEGGVTPHQIALKLAAEEQKPRIVGPSTTTPSVSAIKVRGVDDLLTHLAQCCHPVPGDEIIGYVTRARGVSIHRKDCHNVLNEDETERLIPVEWGETTSLYPVKVQVEAWDRVGLMRDIGAVVAEEKINITTLSLTNNPDHTISFSFSLETANLVQLSKILSKIEGIKGVISAIRVGDVVSGKNTPPSGSPHNSKQ